MVRRLNIDGDGQGDLGGHGGENRAVLVYQLDSYRHWANEFDRDDLTPGYLRGEPHRRRVARRRGLHRRPLPDRRGGLRSHPAAGHLLPRRHANRRAPHGGAAGVAPAARASTAACIDRGRGRRPARRSSRSLGPGAGDGRRDRRAALPSGHPRDALRTRPAHPGAQPGLEGLPAESRRAGPTAATSSGNTGLTPPPPPPPAWPGFRPLRVTAVHDESRARPVGVPRPTPTVRSCRNGLPANRSRCGSGPDPAAAADPQLLAVQRARFRRVPDQRQAGTVRGRPAGTSTPT